MTPAMQWIPKKKLSPEHQAWVDYNVSLPEDVQFYAKVPFGKTGQRMFFGASLIFFLFECFLISVMLRDSSLSIDEYFGITVFTVIWLGLFLKGLSSKKEHALAQAGKWRAGLFFSPCEMLINEDNNEYFLFPKSCITHLKLEYIPRGASRGFFAEFYVFGIDENGEEFKISLLKDQTLSESNAMNLLKEWSGLEVENNPPGNNY